LHYRGRGSGHVALVENLVTPPINQMAEARVLDRSNLVQM